MYKQIKFGIKSFPNSLKRYALNKKYSILNTIKGLKKNTFFLMDYLASKGYSS